MSASIVGEGDVNTLIVCVSQEIIVSLRLRHLDTWKLYRMEMWLHLLCSVSHQTNSSDFDPNSFHEGDFSTIKLLKVCLHVQLLCLEL